MKGPLRWITDNFGMKVASLLLALGFWFYAIGAESIELTKTVPLEIKVPAEELRLVKSSAQYLEVTFETPRHLVSALSSEHMSATHVLEGITQVGDYSFNADSRDIQVPYPEVRVSKIFPSFVTVTVDELIIKKLPVRAELMGDPAFGYRVDTEALVLDPNATLVEGPKAILEKMDSISTEPIELVGRVRSFRRTVRIQADPKLKVMGDGITDVQVAIKAEYSEKEFPDVPVRPMGIPAAETYVQLDEKHISIVLKGPLAILGDVEREAILAFVEVEGLKEGTHDIPVTFILPSDVSLKGDPPVIPVVVRKFKA